MATAPAHETIDLLVGGMTCANCVGRVERTLTRLDGVHAARVNLVSGLARIAYAPGAVGVAEIRAAIRDAGYDAREPAPEVGASDDRAAHEIAALGRDLTLATVFAAPLVLLTMLPMLAPTPALQAMGHALMGWGGALATAPVLWAGRRFYRQGLAEIRDRSLGMSTLVMLGSSAAFAFSVAAIVAPGAFPAGTAHTYFEASASIVTLVLTGKYLEQRAKGRAGQAIRGLLANEARTARVRRGEVDVEIAIDELAVGDTVVVRPGERIPADGVIVEGASFVDEAMVTGEPIPREATVGAALVGGTINGAGSLLVRATRVGRDTVLRRIVRLVEEAQASKAPVQKLADRIAAVFVPVVLAAAALTFGVWMLAGGASSMGHAVVGSLSVLVVACPCAMGLATPTAILVASGRAAELGLVLRDGAALEGFARADTLFLDKTGTLTEGHPAVTAIHAIGVDEHEILRLVAGAEARSEHPVGRAIVRAAEERGLAIPPATLARADVARGLAATVEGHAVKVGTAAYLEASGIDPAPGSRVAAELAARAETAIFASVDGELRGVFAIADPVKPTSRAAVAALSALGLRVVMVTGDAQATALAVAASVGIEDVRAERSPEDKARAVAEAIAAEHVVVFAGDGINDAPALARADVGVAMGSGTDVAIEAGDVILMHRDLRALVDGIRLGKRTLRVIRQSFFWAYAYNVALMPVAAGALYPVLHVMLSPVLAAAAMSASSLFVLANSSRLRAA